MPKINIGDEIELLVSIYALPINQKYKISRISNYQDCFYIEHFSKEYEFSQNDILNGFIQHYPNTTDNDINDLFGVYNSGDWSNGWTSPVPIKILCECGQNKISGHEGDNWELHSKWCPIYIEGKRNAK